MNIYGIGTDIVNIKRINSAIKKNKKSFKKRIYTKFEIKTCEKRKNSIECFAKRFAAKEAFFKAIGVENSLKNLKKIFKMKKFKIHLSLSDDKPWAVALVIIFLYK